MNTSYYNRINNFSLYQAQKNALAKAKALGLNIHPRAYEDNLYPANGYIDISELNRFGNRYVDIFGDDAEKYIFGLAHPFNTDNWYSIKYLPISERILIDDFYVLSYGFEQSIGSVMMVVKRHEHTFSDIKIMPDGAEFYIGDELFAVVNKATFNNEPDANVKEIVSALKGVNTLYDKTELTTIAIHERLKKVKHFENFEGYEISNKDGQYIHSNLSNFTKGFQFILSEFVDEKVPINVAEKVMWAFFGIDNEHVLRANEKSWRITGSLFTTNTYDSNTGLYSDIQNHISLPSALSGFRRLLVSLNLTDKKFHINTRGLGSLLYLSFGEDMDISIQAHEAFTQEYAELCVSEAKKLFAGEITFSSRKDFFIETFIINDAKMDLYDINGELHTVDRLNNMVPINSLLFHTTKSTVWRVEARYDNEPYERPDPSTIPTEWHLSYQKYEKPTTAVTEFGALSLEDVEQVVARLGIKAKYSMKHLDEETRRAIYEINNKYIADEIDEF